MGATRAGGLKAQASIIAKLGEEATHNHRVEIGRAGGLKSRGGGFAHTGNPATDAARSARAKAAGIKGAQRSAEVRRAKREAVR